MSRFTLPWRGAGMVFARSLQRTLSLKTKPPSLAGWSKIAEHSQGHRMRIRALWAHCLVFAALTSCGPDDQAVSPPSTGSGSRLKEFGFVGIDCNVISPHELQGPHDYVDEVAGFTNAAHVCAFGSDDDLRARLARLAANNMRALLAIEPVLFTTVPDATAPGGMRVTLFPDYAQRWQQFVTINAEVLDAGHIASLYLIDEPFLRHLSYEELETAANLVASTHLSIPLSFVEAWSALPDLRVPESVDWIGFDDYAIRDPSTDPSYLANLATLKAARSRADQGIILILDAQWSSVYAAYGMPTPDLMAEVAANYLRLAQQEPDTVALIGYLWPGGLDEPDQLGARELPENVQQEYRRIGAIIAGK